MNPSHFLMILMLTAASCQSQTKKTNPKTSVGGPCEGCEAIFEFGERALSPVDTLPDFKVTEPKLRLRGTVFEKDGETPAQNVILYIYQTNREGLYASRSGEEGWGTRHGYIRGWIKTGPSGQYAFYTFRPAAYPNGVEPEHIHITVKEPNRNEYYIDAFVFADDPLLTQRQRDQLDNRGGSGVVQPEIIEGILTADRDIILGLNIPNYE